MELVSFFRELNLFPNMNVVDNIFMANEFFQKGKINENINMN